eukprot:12373520-Alexandrium_andersonii.AAC.1
MRWLTALAFAALASSALDTWGWAPPASEAKRVYSPSPRTKSDRRRAARVRAAGRRSLPALWTAPPLADHCLWDPLLWLRPPAATL